MKINALAEFFSKTDMGDGTPAPIFGENCHAKFWR
jgi:hypothetical protein